MTRWCRCMRPRWLGSLCPPVDFALPVLALSRVNPLPQVPHPFQRQHSTCGSGLAREEAGTGKSQCHSHAAPCGSGFTREEASTGKSQCHSHAAPCGSGFTREEAGTGKSQCHSHAAPVGAGLPAKRPAQANHNATAMQPLWERVYPRRGRHRQITMPQPCSPPVGAGLPAKRPAQAKHDRSVLDDCDSLYGVALADTRFRCD